MDIINNRASNCKESDCYLLAIKMTGKHHYRNMNYRIIHNKRTLCEGNGLEIHYVENDLFLPVFKAKLYHY